MLALLEARGARGLVTLRREAKAVRSMFGPLRLLADWLRRALGFAPNVR
ncbi:MAG: hypothetical protein H7337_15535 [Rhizobacter sp.]|nr:hypothetical protein [Rhizobacter sp.]